MFMQRVIVFSLLETIAKPFSLLCWNRQLLGDMMSGRVKAVQCYLADQRGVDRIKDLIAGIKERMSKSHNWLAVVVSVVAATPMAAVVAKTQSPLAFL